METIEGLKASFAYADAVKTLKLVASAKPDEKPCFKTSRCVPGTVYGAAYRTYHGESADDGNARVRRALDVVEDIMREKTGGPRTQGPERECGDDPREENINPYMRLLKATSAGIGNLLGTYRDRADVCAKLTGMLATISRIEREHATYVSGFEPCDFSWNDFGEAFNVLHNGYTAWTWKVLVDGVAITTPESLSQQRIVDLCCNTFDFEKVYYHHVCKEGDDTTECGFLAKTRKGDGRSRVVWFNFVRTPSSRGSRTLGSGEIVVKTCDGAASFLKDFDRVRAEIIYQRNRSMGP